MIEIPANGVMKNDYDNVMTEVLKQLATGQDRHGEGAIGTAYIDWGANSDTYKNCPSKSIADKVALAFKRTGHHVYVQRMGRGSSRIAVGTPICYRIYNEACKTNKWDKL